MSNSPYQDTVFILNFLERLGPESVLDIGSGFGKWGFLCRCHLGTGDSLSSNPEQNLLIDAIEVYQKNINPVYDAVYNNTFEGDARDILNGLGMYDVIICGHVIEHMKKDEGMSFITEARKHAKKALILGLPFNDPLRNTPNSNPYESHQSTWTPVDFSKEKVLIRSFKYIKSIDAGVVIYPCDEESRWLVKVINNPLRLILARLRHILRNRKK